MTRDGGGRVAISVAGLALMVSACTPAVPPPIPPTNATTPPAATLAHRAVHTATPLADGSVLVAGGCDIDGCGRATASTFLLTAEGAQPTTPLTGPRDGHTATRLADCRVLVVGGYAGESTPPLATAEIFDPATGAWQPTAPLHAARGGHAGAGLGDGRVLVTGGWVERGTATARTEIFDPATGAFALGPDLPAAVDGHSAATLADGSVLITGSLRQARFKHTMLPWLNGAALVIGGTSDDRTLLPSTEVYDPRTETFRPGPRLAYGRYKLGGSAVSLPDGRVVVAGGGPGAELLDPAKARATPVVQVPGGVASFGTLSVVGAEVWFVGGYDDRVNLTGRDLRVPLAAL